MKLFIVLIDNVETSPMSKAEIVELFENKKIDGSEPARKHPDGQWRKLRDFHDFMDVGFPVVEEVEVEEQVEFNEFKFSKDGKNIVEVDYKKLEEKYESESHEDETVIRKKSTTKPDLEKTIIKKIDKSLLKKAVEESIAPVENVQVVSEEKSIEKIDSDKMTEVINLKEHLSQINKDAYESEKEILTLVENAKSVEKKEEDVVVTTESPSVKSSKRKMMSPIIALVIVGVIYLLLFDEDKKSDPIVPIRPEISFPIAKQYLDEDKSKVEYERGLVEYGKGNYPSLIKAAAYFKQSFEFDSKNDESLGMLIRSYSDLLDDVSTSKSEESGSTLFKLIRLGRANILKDVNIAIGTARFYLEYKKYEAAVTTIENYLRVSPPSVELFVYYLEALIAQGNLEQARKVVEKLLTMENRPKAAYIATANFFDIDEQDEKAESLINEGIEKYPNAVDLLLQKVRFDFENKKIESVVKNLKKVEALKAENSPVYYSKFLEYMGMLAAVQNDNDKAAELFKIALKLNDTYQLRQLLGSLELGGSSQVEKLILESKIKMLMSKAQSARANLKWEDAFKYAISASDLDENNIAAQLLLASIQLDRGYFKSAIDKLEEMSSKYPIDVDIQFALTEAYIRSYKLENANDQIMKMSQTTLNESSHFASLFGRYYLKKNNPILAIKWFQDSINRNPLNGEDYSLLAEIFLKIRRYDQAKAILMKGIEIEPNNPYYHALYAKILYELSGVEVAIGYLRDALKENPFHPKLLGDIAIYYYDSGQTQNFNDTKAQIEKLNSHEISYYQFLVEAAKMNDDIEKVVYYASELIKAFPGDLDTRSVLGEYYYRMKRFKEAEETFIGVINALPSYPKANYYLSLIYSQTEKWKEAKEFAEKEITYNPTQEYGYYVLAQVLISLENYTEAIKNLEKAISLNGKYVEALVSLADVKQKQNYLEVARELYIRAIKEEPNNGNIHKSLGFVYRGIGQRALALESFKVYLDLTPGARDTAYIEKIMQELR